MVSWAQLVGHKKCAYASQHELLSYVLLEAMEPTIDMMDDWRLGPESKPCPTWYDGLRDSMPPGPSPLILPGPPMTEGRAPVMLGLAARVTCPV